MIKFACPHCAAALSGRDDKLGKSGRCPKCLSAIVVERAQSAQLPSVIQSSPAIAAPRKTVERMASSVRLHRTIAVLAVAVSVGTVCVYGRSGAPQEQAPPISDLVVPPLATEESRDEQIRKLKRDLVEAQAVARGERPVFDIGRRACREWFEEHLGLEFDDGLMPDNIVAKHGLASSVLIFGDDEQTKQIIVIGCFSGRYMEDTAELLAAAGALLSPEFKLTGFFEQAARVRTRDATCKTHDDHLEVVVGTSEVSEPPLRIVSFRPAWKITEL